MKRLISMLSTLLSLAVLWTGCQTISDLTVNEEERNMRRLKRGTLSESGLYSNLFYQFELRLPEGWDGVVNDPPGLLKVTPSSKDLAQASARKFVNIQVFVLDRQKEETLDQFVERYAGSKGYERILDRPSTIFGFPSTKILFYGRDQSSEIKITALFVLREKTINVVECHALRPLFDNFESKFGACLDSFKASGTDVPAPPAEDVYPGIDPGSDVVMYIVSPTDTIESLAKRFLGSEDRSWIIIASNEFEKLNAGERIKIPRSIPYEVRPGDTWPSVAQKILEDPGYATWVSNYNGNTDLSSAKTIQIPLYTIETPGVGDTYLEIARRYYKDDYLAERLLEYNNLEPLESLEKIKLPIFLIDRYYTYRVQPNDSLAWIARWLTGDSNNYQQIAQINGIEYPYRLVIGQELKIPASLVPDPSVFDKPIPKSRPTPKPAGSEPAKSESDAKPTAAPVSTPTSTPRPINDTGLFDIE
ncbi:LysM peptidoglycan-binding domain-containing protein [bacterium]|nr:LysM peptidoglycan-binding domain-containing protein [candidate division CSSED10-310 bacterium]